MTSDPNDPRGRSRGKQPPTRPRRRSDRRASQRPTDDELDDDDDPFELDGDAESEDVTHRADESDEDRVSVASDAPSSDTELSTSSHDDDELVEFDDDDLGYDDDDHDDDDDDDDDDGSELDIDDDDDDDDIAEAGGGGDGDLDDGDDDNGGGDDDNDDDGDDDDDDHDDARPPAPTVSVSRSIRSLTAISLLAAAAIAGVVYLQRGSLPLDAPSLAVVEGEAEAEAVPKPERKPSKEATEPLEPTIRRPGPWYEHDWTKGIKPPREVHYTIRSGGTLKNVANLYKIYHHEIAALNPGIDLDKQLGPKTRVLVHRHRDDTPSVSLGYPGDGKLQGGVPMVTGPGRELRAIPWKSFATAETVAMLDKLLEQWPKREPSAHPVLVGNMSAREGGRLKPHSSHQSGRDFDLSYIQRAGVYDELNWREMNADNLDAEKTWSLIKLFAESGATEAIFIDKNIQKLLYDHALANGTVPKGELSQWLQYPHGSAGANVLVQHVPGHVDHMHVRFACPPSQSACKSRRLDEVASR